MAIFALPIIWGELLDYQELINWMRINVPLTAGADQGHGGYWDFNKQIVLIEGLYITKDNAVVGTEYARVYLGNWIRTMDIISTGDNVSGYLIDSREYATYGTSHDLLAALTASHRITFHSNTPSTGTLMWRAIPVQTALDLGFTPPRGMWGVV